MIEELKMILDTIQGLGGDAKDIAIAWLCIRVMGMLFAYGLGVTGAVLVYKAIKHILRSFRAVVFEEELAQAYDGSHDLYESDRQAIKEIVSKNAKKKKG